nr:EOG090X01AN [Eulimnadia texana]
MPSLASDVYVAAEQQKNAAKEENTSCKVKSKTALSAIQRATTQQCKDEITDVACKLQQGVLFTNKLTSYCVRNNSSPRQLLGCYLDNSDSRLLSSYGVKMHSATVDRCIDTCIQHSFPYAGLKDGQECYCGLVEPSKSLAVPLSYCHLTCNGNSSQKCGGKDSLLVYDTGSPTREAAKLSEPRNTGTARIAFILTVNGRALRHAIRLLKLIYREKHFYYIHVDARQDYLFRNLLYLENDFSNIRIIRKRQSTIWGGSSLLDALLDVISEALNQKWDFVLNLSESDFPVRSVDDLEAFLGSNQARNFLKSHGRQVKQFIQKQGLDRVFLQCESRMWRVGDRKIPTGVRIDGGSDWFVLSRPFAEYSVLDKSDLSTGLKHFFRYTLLPAESFFHTLLLNSPLCSTYADNNLRMTLWRRSQGCLCQHKKVVDWCGCSPMVFRTSDWPQLESAIHKGNIFFARKFEASLDQTILNKLEETIRQGIRDLEQSWDSYWESVYDANDPHSAPSNAFVSAADGFLQNAVQLTQNKLCVFRPGNLVSVTSYFHHDYYKGDLFLWELTEPMKGYIEVWIKPMAKPTIKKRFSLFQVGSDLDPKEQVFRNRLGILSQKTEPVLLYKWIGSGSGNTGQVKFVWVDPSQKVRAVHSVNVTDNSSTGHDNSGIAHPLALGTWTVHAVENDKQIGSAEFLILPEEGLQESKTDDHPQQKHFESLLGLAKNVSLTVEDRSIDRLLLKFYSLQDVCFEGLPESCSDSRHRKCSLTNWSSMAPDPKSQFGKSRS